MTADAPLSAEEREVLIDWLTWAVRRSLERRARLQEKDDAIERSLDGALCAAAGDPVDGGAERVPLGSGTVRETSESAYLAVGRGFDTGED